MPLFGTLKTMALPDLLQWLATARMTGTLQIERSKVAKAILMKDGEVVGCSSDDPPERLGHFLLARGKITEDQLREALATQETERKHLGMILVSMGALSPDELSSHLEAKAEETIYSLFDWQDAVFRFQQGQTDEANIFPVSLRVEDVLLRGFKRFDEVQRIREVFNDPGIVLRRTAKLPPREVFANRMARTLYGSIDGERTVAEILLHVHGSEYTVTKFLFELHRNGFVEIACVRPTVDERPEEPEQNRGAPPETPDRDADTHASVPPVTAAPAPPAAGSGPAHIPGPRPVATSSVAVDLPPACADAPAGKPSAPPSRLEQARSLMTRGELDLALDLLDALYRENPQDDSLRRLSAEAEAAFVEKAYRHYLPAHKVPVLCRPMEDLVSENLSPTEFFLLSRVDGVWDLKSIIQIAPLREADALRTLKRLREAGMIELRESR